MVNMKDIAELFEIGVGSNLDSKTEDLDSKTEEPLSSFKERCKDVRLQMEEEPHVETDTEVITEALNRPLDTETSKLDDDAELEVDIPGDVEAVVDSDIAAFEQELSSSSITPAEPEIKTEFADMPKSAEPDIDIDIDIELGIDKTSVEPSSLSAVSDRNKDNPLELEGVDLIAYRQIMEHWPQFNVYDGSLAFRDFYRWKVHYLRILLGRFPVLDLGDMCDELKGISTDHFVGEHAINPDLIRRKIDDAQRCRTRVGTLLINVFEQYYPWERFLDMLRAKLFKDHEIKGAHRRDATLLEHLSDMEQYVAEMKGFSDAAKHSDMMLRAASDSLSRQLTCLQIKESLGLSPPQLLSTNLVEPSIGIAKRSASYKEQLDDLDGVAEGTVISAPVPSGGGATKVEYGQEDEILTLLG